MRPIWRPPAMFDRYTVPCRRRSAIIVGQRYASGLPRRMKTGDAALDAEVAIVTKDVWLLGLLSPGVRRTLLTLVTERRLALHDGELQVSLAGLAGKARDRVERSVKDLAKRLGRGRTAAITGLWSIALEDPAVDVRDRALDAALSLAASSRVPSDIFPADADPSWARTIVAHVTQELGRRPLRHVPMTFARLIGHLADNPDPAAGQAQVDALAALVLHGAPALWSELLGPSVDLGPDVDLAPIAHALLARAAREPAVVSAVAASVKRLAYAVPSLSGELVATLGTAVGFELLEAPWPESALRSIYLTITARIPGAIVALARHLDDHPDPSALVALLGRVAGLEALPALRPLSRGLFRSRAAKAAARDAIAAIEARHPTEHLVGALSAPEADAGLALVDDGGTSRDA